MGKQPPKWLPGERVQETILLQRKSVDELRADRILRKDKLAEKREKHKNKIDAKRKRKLQTKKFISAQTILKYALRQKHQSRKFYKVGEKMNSKVKSAGEEVMAAKYAKTGVALLVRCKGDLVPKAVRLAFERLGLKKLYTARLVHVGPTTYKVLQQLKPFSILGYPSEQHMEKLIRTRGCLWSEESQTKRFISGNRLLEEAMGQYNILCIEDLTAAIFHKDANIDAILKQLAPFDFHPPRQLFMERHRTAHQKLEIINPESFAAYLSEQLGEEAKELATATRQKAIEAAKQAKKVDAAKQRAEAAKAKAEAEQQKQALAEAEQQKKLAEAEQQKKLAEAEQQKKSSVKEAASPKTSKKNVPPVEAASPKTSKKNVSPVEAASPKSAVGTKAAKDVVVTPAKVVDDASPKSSTKKSSAKKRVRDDTQ